LHRIRLAAPCQELYYVADQKLGLIFGYGRIR
jgi:hypothetical protein